MYFERPIMSYLPLPEIGDQVSFRQRSQNDSNRISKRPPKLYQKAHDISYTRSLNQSIPHEISFRNNKSPKNASLNHSTYKKERPGSYFEQCFDVIARIGEGSFGEVFKVRSREDGRLYAIKRSKKLYRGEVARQECINEVRQHEKFSDNEHCVTLYKAWEQNDLLYMQLELCKSNLETFSLKNDNLSETRVWEILVDLLLALKELHDQNLIHLDIKLENVLIGADNVCKLGDFGLVMDMNQPNLPQPREGDSRYIAPEVLQGRFTKAADIFSLGIAILELACRLDLPQNGVLWHRLRSGMLPDEFINLLSHELQQIIKWMMNPDPFKRPDINALLASHRIQNILSRRKMLHPLKKIKKWTKFITTIIYMLQMFVINLFTKISSALKLSKRRHRKDVTAHSTPRPLGESSDDSFLQLEDSKIDFDDSPSNRSANKSFLKASDLHIVNSTPLNHYNSHGSFRRNRCELSRTSLVFDDCENLANSSQHSSNWRETDSETGIQIKCKKLFDGSDDSN